MASAAYVESIRLYERRAAWAAAKHGDQDFHTADPFPNAGSADWQGALTGDGLGEATQETDSNGLTGGGAAARSPSRARKCPD